MWLIKLRICGRTDRVIIIQIMLSFSFELSYQQDALKDPVKLVNTYPDSRYIDEARSSLGELMMSTKNYKDANNYA